MKKHNITHPMLLLESQGVSRPSFMPIGSITPAFLVTSLDKKSVFHLTQNCLKRMKMKKNAPYYALCAKHNLIYPMLFPGSELVQDLGR